MKSLFRPHVGSSDGLLVAFYFLFKTIFLVWLMLPATRGAEVMWRSFVQPMYRSYSGKIHGSSSTSGYATNTTSFNTASTERKCPWQIIRQRSITYYLPYQTSSPCKRRTRCKRRESIREIERSGM